MMGSELQGQFHRNSRVKRTRCSILSLVMVSPLAFWTVPAFACAVCGGFGKDDPSRWAFLLTFAIMTAVPLLLFTAFLLFLRKRMREQSADEESEPQA